MKAKSLIRFTTSALAAVAISGLLASGASAQQNPGDPATLSATAAVDIGNQLELTETGAGMNFGIIARPQTGTTEDFTVTPAGAISEAGDSPGQQLIDGSAALNGAFSITGETTNTYAVTLTAGGACTGGTLAGVTLSAMTIDGGNFSRTLAAGSDTFEVGATITVGACPGGSGGFGIGSFPPRGEEPIATG
jgi:hypothetical protein